MLDFVKKHPLITILLLLGAAATGSFMGSYSVLLHGGSLIDFASFPPYLGDHGGLILGGIFGLAAGMYYLFYLLKALEGGFGLKKAITLGMQTGALCAMALHLAFMLLLRNFSFWPVFFGTIFGILSGILPGFFLGGIIVWAWTRDSNIEYERESQQRQDLLNQESNYEPE